MSLELRNINAGYGATAVLHDLTLRVDPGEIVSVIGANGAGKTTTLMCISRLLAIRSGEILFEGHDLCQRAAYQLPQLGLAHVPEGRRVFPRLSVLENLELGALVRGKQNLTTDFERVYSLFPVLADRKNQYAGTLSGGEQQMLAIARALMSNPRLLLLDEPSMGIAPILVQKIFETLLELNKQGMTMLLVEQNAHLALAVSKRAYVIEVGTVTMEGEGQTLAKDSRIREAYLGT